MMATPSTPLRAPLGRRLVNSLLYQLWDLLHHFLRRWYAYAAMGLAGIGLSHFVGINFTNSLPERVVWLSHGELPQRGDLVVFRFKARSGPTAPLDGTRWLKRVRGMPGDEITVNGREVLVNGSSIGLALPVSGKGARLDPIQPGAIPAGWYFVAGTSADSLDSRYLQVGLVPQEQIEARGLAIF